jgi:ADP-ribosylglycohydrolase
VLSATDGSKLNDGGYSPDVLRAALYWMRKASNFTDAVEGSIAFAGPANYCPVCNSQKV